MNILDTNWLKHLGYALFGYVRITAEPGVTAMLTSFGILIVLRLLSRAWQYLKKIPIAIYVFISEHKRIIHIPWYKKVFFCFTWPIFDIIHRYTSYVALFVRVTWKPIPHTSKVTIHDVEK